MNNNSLQDINTIVVTGGLGFIGTNYIIKVLELTNIKIINIDKEGYASSDFGIEKCLHKIGKEKAKNYIFYKLNINNQIEITKIFNKFQPDLIINFAAESHVDRSIDNPYNFIENNILGTFNLLEATRHYYNSKNISSKKKFKLHHISTDEVFGSLGEKGYFNEYTQYDPSSPYSASKASSDHLVKAWNSTFQIPILISNCSNNFGPWQFPEKLIPLVILKINEMETIPIYGNGSNIRDWLYVDDHIDALISIQTFGEIGETYCIGGGTQISNLNLVEEICNLFNTIKPSSKDYKSLIDFVDDRPGHDFRYAIKNDKISDNLGWKPKYPFKNALKKTLEWYLDNLDWCKKVMDDSGYYGERIGKE